MKVEIKELTAEDRKRAKQIRAKYEARRAASPPTPVSKEFIDKMTSGIADPDEAERERQAKKDD